MFQDGGWFVGVVCPMANEGEKAVPFVQAVLQQFPPSIRAVCLVVVDKASKDGTLHYLLQYSKADSRLKVVWAPECKNVVDAYVRGYREALAAGCDWILEIDAGFSHQPDEIPRFLAKLDQPLDCIFGSRFMPGGKMDDPLLKRYLVSLGGTILTNWLLGTKLKDMTSGFEMFSRRTMEQLLERGIHSKAHFFQTEIKVYCRNLAYIEVPISYRNPSPRLGFKALRDAFEQLWRLTKMHWFTRQKRSLHAGAYSLGGDIHLGTQQNPGRPRGRGEAEPNPVLFDRR